MNQSRSDWPVLARAPRHVPLETRLGVRLAHRFAQAACLILCIALVALWAIVPRTDFADWGAFEGSVATAQGRVVTVESTGEFTGGRRGRGGSPVMRYDFEFELEGRRFSGSSFRRVSDLERGSACTLEFPTGKPERARIVGMRSAPYGPEVLFTFLVPLVGLGLLIASQVAASRALHLLENGVSTLGRLVDAPETTSSFVRNRKHHRVSFEFDTESGRTQRVDVRTRRVKVYEDRRGLRVLYDPREPRRALVIDELDVPVAFDALGRVQEISMRRLTLASLLPTFAVGGYSAFATWLALH